MKEHCWFGLTPSSTAEKCNAMEFFEEQGAVLRQMISSLRMRTERSFSEVM